MIISIDDLKAVKKKNLELFLHKTHSCLWTFMVPLGCEGKPLVGADQAKSTLFPGYIPEMLLFDLFD